MNTIFSFSQSYHGGANNSDDAQLWQNIYVEKSLSQKFNIHINEEARLTHNFTLPSYIYADFGITYKFRKYLHFTIAYVPIAKKQQDNNVSYRHQFYADVTLKIKVHHFVFYDRIMYQEQYNDVNRSPDWDIANHYFRNKVTIKHKSSTRFVPYVAAELYYQYENNQDNGMQTDRMRYFAGCFYELDKLNEFELYYLVEPHFNVNKPYTNYIIGVGFAHNLY